jgi:predicted transcriptional regulator
MDKMTPMTVRVSTAPKNRLDKRAAAIRTGKEDVREGRIMSHEKAARWLRSWGKKRELPPPSCV